MTLEEAVMIRNAVADNIIKKLKYVGPEIRTRGEGGDPVIFGYEFDKRVYVWKTGFGWILWSGRDSGDWEETNLVTFT